MEARVHPVAYGSAIDAACVRGRAERLYEEDVGCGWCGELGSFVAIEVRLG